MKKLIITLKILGYICITYSIIHYQSETYPLENTNPMAAMQRAGLAVAKAFTLKMGYIGLASLLISEALSLRKCKKD